MADALKRPTLVERAMRVRKAHDVGVAGGGRRRRTNRAAAKVVGASPRPSGVHAVDLFASGHHRTLLGEFDVDVAAAGTGFNWVRTGDGSAPAWHVAMPFALGVGHPRGRGRDGALPIAGVRLDPDLLARTVGACARRGRRQRTSHPERIVAFEGGGA